MGKMMIEKGRRNRKFRRLGDVSVVDRREYMEADLETKVELILGLIPLGLMHVQETLEDEVKELAGEWHT